MLSRLCAAWPYAVILSCFSLMIGIMVATLPLAGTPGGMHP